MIEAMKIAAKVALIAIITGAIIALFAGVQIPGLDFTVLTNALGTALALAYHWCPGLSVILPVAIAMWGVYLAILLFHYAMIGVRWIIKVNE